jgi:hypothetical protein
MVDVVKRERGAVTIQVALFLPILFIVLLGTFELWKVLYVRQTLSDAAAQGMRLISLQSNVYGIQDEAEALMRRAVAQNGLVGPRALDPEQLEVRIYTTRHCDDQVQIALGLQWTVGSEFGRPDNGWLPFIGHTGTLQFISVGVVTCDGSRNAR